MVKFNNNSSEILSFLEFFFASIKLVPTISNLMKGIQGEYNSVVVDLIYNEFINDYEQYVIENKDITEKDNLQFKKLIL